MIDIGRSHEGGVWLPVSRLRSISRAATTLTCTAFDPQSHESLFFAKFHDWSYEQEVRVVLPLDECRQELVGAGLLHIYEIPRSCVARVIVGWNVSPDKIATVQKYVGTANPDVEIHQAHFVRGRVAFSETVAVMV